MEKEIKLLVIDDDDYFSTAVERMMISMKEENIKNGCICTCFEIKSSNSNVEGRIEISLKFKTKMIKLA